MRGTRPLALGAGSPPQLVQGNTRGPYSNLKASLNNFKPVRCLFLALYLTTDSHGPKTKIYTVRRSVPTPRSFLRRQRL
jgi:hypothetical protein